MTITQKLLIPTLAFFVMVMLALIGFNTLDATISAQSQEAKELNHLHRAFQNWLKTEESLAMALATEAANTPQIQAAFAARDRARLMELTLPTYSILKEQFGVEQYHFHTPPATSFLRLHALHLFGDDVSDHRFTVAMANAERRPVSGLEIGRGGLGVRGVVPVTFEGNHVGTVEFGMDPGQALLEELKEQYGADWQILLSRHPAEIIAKQTTGAAKAPTPDLLFQFTTLKTPLFAEETVYRQALSGRPSISHVHLGSQEYALLSAPLHDFSGKIIGVVDTLSNRTEVVRAADSRLTISIIAMLAALTVGGVGLTLITMRVLLPIKSLTDTAAAIAAGDLTRTARVESNDEIGRLATAFNSMTAQLRDLIGSLEQRIAERTRAEELLRAGEQRLRTILGSVQAGIILIDVETRTILDANPMALQMMGVTKDKVIGSVCHRFICPREEGSCPVADLGQQVNNSERILLTSSGEQIPIIKTVVPVDLDNRKCLLESFIDITEHKRAEAERERLTSELEAKNAELERFVYTVSHDLKSPLITIQGFLGYIEQNAIEGNVEQVQTDMARVVNAINKMHQLLRELLELSRIGRLMTPPEEVSFGDLVHEAMNMVAGRLAQKGVQVDISPDLPVVFVDRPRLREVLQNLLENASKFMVGQPHPRIQVAMRIDGENRVFTVRDNGMGIDPRDHEKIFGLFQKLDHKTEGTGVGLAIVKRILEVHGGRIWVESEGLGKGSTFCFTLPHGGQ